MPDERVSNDAEVPMGKKGYEKEFPNDDCACDAVGLYTSVDIAFSTVAGAWEDECDWCGGEELDDTDGVR